MRSHSVNVAFCMATLCIAVLLLLSACRSTPTDGKQSITIESTAAPESMITETPGTLDSYAPLKMERRIMDYGSGYITYPYVKGEGESGINSSMYEIIESWAMECPAPVFTNYSIKHNSDGIFSLVITAYDLYTSEVQFKLPLCYDAMTGKRLFVTDLFSTENEGWRNLIPDMITAQAESTDITLLSGILPLSDSQGFYICESDIVFVYRPYEISTYAAGSPEFSVPVSGLSAYIPPEGYLARLIPEQ